MTTYLGAPTFHHVRVADTGNRPLLIDGWPEVTPWEGWYTSGSLIEIEVPPQSRPYLRNWAVNGEHPSGDEAVLRLEVEDDLTIAAEFAPESPDA